MHSKRFFDDSLTSNCIRNRFYDAENEICNSQVRQSLALVVGDHIRQLPSIARMFNLFQKFLVDCSVGHNVVEDGAQGDGDRICTSKPLQKPY